MVNLRNETRAGENQGHCCISWCEMTTTTVQSLDISFLRVRALFLFLLLMICPSRPQARKYRSKYRPACGAGSCNNLIADGGRRATSSTRHARRRPQSCRKLSRSTRRMRNTQPQARCSQWPIKQESENTPPIRLRVRSTARPSDREQLPEGSGSVASLLLESSGMLHADPRSSPEELTLAWAARMSGDVMTGAGILSAATGLSHWVILSTWLMYTHFPPAFFASQPTYEVRPRDHGTQKDGTRRGGGYAEVGLDSARLSLLAANYVGDFTFLSFFLSSFVRGRDR